jgi:hypothetical protein
MRTSTPTSELVDAVGVLHSIFVPAVEIARRMHCTVTVVDHIIQHGTAPSVQLTLLWTDPPATSYEHPTR